jgi:hypothetical protein
MYEFYASSEEITHLVKIPRYVRFFNFDWMELVAEILAVRRPPRTGDAWIKLHMSVFRGSMELVVEGRCS